MSRFRPRIGRGECYSPAPLGVFRVRDSGPLPPVARCRGRAFVGEGWLSLSPLPRMRSMKGMYVANRSMKTGLFFAAIALVASIGLKADPQTNSQAPAGPKAAAVQSPTQRAEAGANGPTLHASAPDPALVQKYCLTCHSARVKTGGLSLEGMNPAEAAAHSDVWEKVVMKLRGGMMPPQGMPRPDEATLEAF